MEEAGLEVEVDEGGNMTGSARDGGDVWTGSHLDTVPSGGKFDGALGVVAGIEAVERAGRGAVVAFRDEERGCVGSTGALPDPNPAPGRVAGFSGRPNSSCFSMVGFTSSSSVFLRRNMSRHLLYLERRDAR